MRHCHADEKNPVQPRVKELMKMRASGFNLRSGAKVAVSLAWLGRAGVALASHTNL